MRRGHGGAEGPSVIKREVGCRPRTPPPRISRVFGPTGRPTVSASVEKELPIFRGEACVSGPPTPNAPYHGSPAGAELAIAAPSETKTRRPLVADTGAWPLAPQPESGALRAPARRTGLRDLGPVPRAPDPTSDPGRPGSQRGNTVRLPAPAPPPHVAASPTNSASRRPRAAGPRE